YAHPSSMLEKLKPILISNFFERVFSGFTPALMSEKPFSFIQYNRGGNCFNCISLASICSPIFDARKIEANPDK
ncbi:hypothetical protein, partial [Enterobacter hormaechei]|uniref:hypothetical protein n=1 Tax=Enterobacter hormaechei TaxID=158836 RepID=UPI00197AD48A